MYEILLGVIGCYGAVVAAVYIIRLIAAERARLEQHYILMVSNEASRLEGCIRRLLRFSRQTGTPIRITVFDQGSTDDTPLIAVRWGSDVSLCRSELQEEAAGDGLLWSLRNRGIVGEGEQPVMVDLRNPDDWFKLPF